MTWDTNNGGTVARAEAIVKIKEIAKDKGITGTFKVFYDGNMVANPNDLPEQVDMAKVKVSAVLDNATV